MMTLAMVLEWTGCAFGVMGAALLATHTRWSRYGWPLYLVSNMFWIGYALDRDANGLLVQQIVFTATSVFGFYRWFFGRGPDFVLLGRNQRQKDILAWAMRTFGAQTAGVPAERIRRFAEEAIELAQAAGMSEAAMTEMVRYVFSRPAGDPAQEVGGVSISLLGYCELVGLSADECESREFARVLAKDAAYFRRRQDAKALAGVALASTEVVS